MTIFITSFISSFKIISVVTPDSNIFSWIAASVVDDPAVNLNDNKTLLANDLSIFPIKGDSGFSNGPKSLPKNPPDSPILWSWVFDSFITADKTFAKAKPQNLCIS